MHLDFLEALQLTWNPLVNIWLKLSYFKTLKSFWSQKQEGNVDMEERLLLQEAKYWLTEKVHPCVSEKPAHLWTCHHQL